MAATNLWKRGTVDGFTYEAKVYDEGSEFGIDGGRISKLTVYTGCGVGANYDRGWDMEPLDVMSRTAVKKICEMYA